jgi:hypothetical protein
MGRLRRRRSKPFRVISVLEESFDTLTRKQQQKYELTRDVDDLPLDRMKPKPAVYLMYPLKPKWDHMLGAQGFNQSDIKFLVRHHLKAVTNPIEDWTLEKDDDGLPTKECIDGLPTPIVSELGKVCIEASGASTVPFTPQDTSAISIRRQIAKSYAEDAEDDDASNQEETSSSSETTPPDKTTTDT